MQSTHVHFSGRVQGVGFRYTAAHLAKAYRLKGWVRNLPDGRVEALFQGEPASILSVLTQLEGNPGMIRVDEISREEVDHEACGDFTVLR